MNQNHVLEVLKSVGAVLVNGHFVYTSRRHGSAYVNKDAVYPHVQMTSWLCHTIARAFVGRTVEVVIGPTIGGVILSQWTAHHLSTLCGRKVLSTYAEKSGDGFVITRGYDKLIAGKRVLVVEDVLTTGGSAKKVIEAVRAIDGEIVGLGVLCNRGGLVGEDFNVPKLYSLTEVPLESWAEADCPLCKGGVPINANVGKGREFLARKQAA